MWTVEFGDLFDAWLEEQEEGLQEKMLADLLNLQTYGPALSRPYADTVKGSRHKNMKELRVQYSSGILCIRSGSKSYCALCR